MLANAIFASRALSRPCRPMTTSLLAPMAQHRGFSGSGFAYPCPRKLREIMKMSAIEKEQTRTIEMIWNDYH